MRPLHRTVLSLAVAAVLAAMIPFSAIYVAALHRSQALATLPATSAGGRQLKLVTTASGRTIAVPAGGQTAAGAPSAALTTRASASAGGDQ